MCDASLLIRTEIRLITTLVVSTAAAAAAVAVVLLPLQPTVGVCVPIAEHSCGI